jgi:hypothetical protein
MVAGLLSVPVAIGLAIVLTTAPRPPDTQPGPTLGTLPSSGGLIGGSPTAHPSPDPLSSPGSNRSSPSAGGSPAWAPGARVMLEADRELLAMRDRLSSIARARPSRTSEIAGQLRVLNPALIVALRLLDGMAANGAPADLVADVRAMYSTTLEASLGTLTASQSDAPAYEAGAKEVIASLANLEDLMARVEKEAGLPRVDPS